MRLVVGCEVAIDDAPLNRVWLHVATSHGYKNLCSILTKSHKRHPKGKPRTQEENVPRNQFAGIPIDDVCTFAGGLWCLAPPEGRTSLARLKDAFGERLSLAAWRHFDGEDDARGARSEAIVRDFAIPVCATNRVLFARPEDKLVIDVLHCIREGVTLDEAGRALLSNAEAHLKSGAEMEALFADRPAWLARGRDVADACRFSLRELTYRFPFELESPSTEIRRRGAPSPHVRGRSRSLSGRNPGQRARADREGARAHQQDERRAVFPQRALDRRDCASARHPLPGAGQRRQQRRLLLPRHHGGRPVAQRTFSSSASSPPSAREPPDIDVDFEHERREEVIQAIYDKYGRDRAAMVSEVISYRGKSALREVGKVFGLSLEQVDRLSVSRRRGGTSSTRCAGERVAECGFDPGDARVGQVLAMAHAIQGFPRHLSIHVGGFVLSAEPLVERRARRAGDDAQSHGHPVGQGRSRHARLLQGRRPRPGHADGHPQGAGASCTCVVACQGHRSLRAHSRRRIRSSTTRSARPTRWASSRSRAARRWRCCRGSGRESSTISSSRSPSCAPGPSRAAWSTRTCGGATGRSGPRSPHPMLAPILERTLGVPLFQEQVMQIAIVGAGYTRWRGRPASARHGRVEAQREAREAPRAAPRGVREERHHARVRRAALQVRSRASASTAFPRATRRASRSSSTRARG